jgi:cytochrome c
LTLPVWAADAKLGADSFDANCADCHSIAKPLKNKKGPGLVGLINRKAGSIAGYDYSDAMKATDFNWTQEKLDAYIKNPKQLVPNDKMKFKGLPDENERKDLIAFLGEQKE